MSGALRVLRRRGALETGVALALSLAAAALHLRFLRHAGGLWRDEAHSIALATLPWQRLLESLWLDSFPLGPSLVLRGWAALAGDADTGLRVLGFAVGLALLGVLWWNARGLGSRAPLVSLTLVGLSPLAVRTVDAVRPHGLGILFGLLAFGAFARVLRGPRRSQVALAALAAVASVQCLYQNAVLLGAIALGVGAACLRTRAWRTALVAWAVCGAAGATLLPYTGIVLRAREWMVFVRQEIPPAALAGLVAEAFAGALASPSLVFAGLWAAAVAAAALLAARRTTHPGDAGPNASDGTVAYCAATAVACVLGFAALVAGTGTIARAWYFVPALAVAASALDGILGRARGGAPWRATFAALGLAVGILPAWREVGLRQTNVDLVASALERLATDDDLVVVHPWFLGVPFARYYDGPAPWTTIPPLPLPALALHRYDLLEAPLRARDPMAPLRVRVADTLRGGGRVWVLNPLPRVADAPPLRLPPAPHPRWGWLADPYIYQWTLDLARFVATHARERRPVQVNPAVAVQRLERANVEVVEGWRD